MRPSDLFHPDVITELLRLYRKNPEWVRYEFDRDAGGDYKAHCLERTPCADMAKRAHDLIVLWGGSHWLGNGPKFFLPTKEQCEVFENVDVNLTLAEYSQPFPALVVGTDYPPYHATLCYHRPGHFLAGFALSKKEGMDSANVTLSDDSILEESLSTFPDERESKEVETQAYKCFRVAYNSALFLSNFGHRLSLMFPKEVESDSRLAKEKSDRGERARQRLSLPVYRVSFEQNVSLTKRVVGGDKEDGPPTNRTVTTHWRRGHWAMQPCGTGRLQRKRIFRPPVMVRADLFTGDPSQTMTTYRG